jgi:peroxiredoxin
MLLMEQQYRAFRAEGVEVIAVNIGESEGIVNRFVHRNNLTFTKVIDRDRKLFEDYTVMAVPLTVLIDKDGIVTKVHQGGKSEKQIISYMESIKP